MDALATKSFNYLTMTEEGREHADKINEQLIRLKLRLLRTYGFVNIMSEAPNVQRVCRDEKYDLHGITPHIKGSSKLNYNEDECFKRNKIV